MEGAMVALDGEPATDRLAPRYSRAPILVIELMDAWLIQFG
jgi:hypothetical protein